MSESLLKDGCDDHDLLRESGRIMPAVGYAAGGDPTWASRADENLDGFGG
ncbi:hypothetical protein [Streptosporangium sp. NPDC002721]